MTTIPWTTTATTTPTSTAATKINADFDMFLKLLTTQMQNQDPLDPMDTSEYTQQLVQYSQVEQSIEQTGTLKEILAGLGSQGLTQASTLIGHQVQFAGAVSGLGDAPATWTWEASRPIATLNATILDSTGRTVATKTIGAGAAAGDFAWDGTLATGGKAPAGAYTLVLTGQDAGGNEVKPTVRSTGIVRDVRQENGTVTLGVNGIQLPASSVARITS